MRIRHKQGWILLLLILALGIMTVIAEAESMKIEGQVWAEKTVDGIMNNESGLADAIVTLEMRGADGIAYTVATGETDKNGRYSFSVSQSGEYRLKILLPGKYQFTLPGVGSAALPAQGKTGYTAYFPVSAGQTVVKNIGATTSSSSVTVLAFEDKNANGGRLQAEPLMRGVLIELLYEQDGETYVIASESTDKNGLAKFTGLSPATYRVRATLPNNYTVGPLGAKINTYYNCFLPYQGGVALTESFSLAAKESIAMGVGAVKSGSLSGKVWLDENANGYWDGSEGGCTAVTVTLTSDSLAAPLETHPDETGAFSFNGLQAGAYQLHFQLPDGLIFTAGGNSLLTESVRSASLNVTIQTDVTTALGAVGVSQAASIVLEMYQDVNCNGMRDTNEKALAGVQVTLIQGGETMGEAVTDASGQVSFPTVRGGEATISCVLPEGFVFSPAGGDNIFDTALPSNQAQATVSVPAAQASSFSGGAVQSAAISGMLFEDPENTGLYTAGDALLPGFTVQAINAQGQIVQETVTDDAGFYSLSPLVPGTYTVRFLLTDPYVAAAYTGDMDMNSAMNHIKTQLPEYGETETVTLAAGQMLDDLDGGVFRAGVVEGTVSLSEGGYLSGVTVTLLDANDAAFSDFTYDVTDENGHFYIKGVLPGTYSLLYTLPEHAVFATGEKMEYQSSQFTIRSGETLEAENVYAEKTAELAGHVLHLGEPVQAALTLTNTQTGTVLSTQTDAAGAYCFTGLPAGDYVLMAALPSGYIFGEEENSPIDSTMAATASASLTLTYGQLWQNADISAAKVASLAGLIFYDDNLSASRDAAEYGAEGRAFTLWRGTELVASAETDSNGAFLFTQLAPGEYTLQMQLEDNEVVVSGAQKNGAVWEASISLADGERMHDFMLPVMRYAAITGQIWSLDGSDSGVSGIPVSIYDQTGRMLSATTTAEDGSYSFQGLLSGTYLLSASLPDGYLFSRTQESISGRSSYIISGENAQPQSVPFTLTMGEDLTGIDIGIGAMGSIGDRAWLDENENGMQDLGEPDMPGIIIELYQQGERVASTVTDAFGHWKLTNLFPGEYEMRVTMHAELKATVHQDDFPLVASIMPQSEETTVSFTMVVPSGTENLHCDLGFVLRSAGGYPAAMQETPAMDWTPYSQRK